MLVPFFYALKFDATWIMVWRKGLRSLTCYEVVQLIESPTLLYTHLQTKYLLYRCQNRHSAIFLLLENIHLQILLCSSRRLKMYIFNLRAFRHFYNRLGRYLHLNTFEHHNHVFYLLSNRLDK